MIAVQEEDVNKDIVRVISTDAFNLFVINEPFKCIHIRNTIYNAYYLGFISCYFAGLSKKNFSNFKLLSVPSKIINTF